ncbi:DNA polymerase III subunit beta [Anaerolineales bacterium HSG6]|nr:DNA polymerase III subunit beta [Anaerolineales bacterium HSG6]MDM8531128.1 DNA polymerase III subunit beta [Anaerolineales bacterium HSG25]
MKVSCLQENLIKGLSTVGRAVASRSTLPVLSNVLLSTDNGQLKLSATNLEIGINYWLGAKVEEEGSITVPARLLTDFVNSLPAERIDLNLDVETQTLNVRCARFKSNIKGIDSQEFPIVATAEDGASSLKLNPDSLRTMIEQVVFAAATDESRPILTGVLVQFNEDNLTMAAADGYRLSVKSAPLLKNAQDMTEVVIPARALTELARISADQEEPVEVIITPARKQILFRLSHVDLVSQLIEGKFPDYNQIIPDGHTTRSLIDTQGFLKAVRVAYLFARDSANIVKLEIIPGEDQPTDGQLSGGQIRLSANSAEIGDNASEVDAAIIGDSVEIAFNAKYMIDVLSIINAPQVAVETSVESAPGVIKPIGDDVFTHIIMPMHINR